jgi:hypothetical protein
MKRHDRLLEETRARLESATGRPHVTHEGADACPRCGKTGPRERWCSPDTPRWCSRCGIEYNPDTGAVFEPPLDSRRRGRW